MGIQIDTGVKKRPRQAFNPVAALTGQFVCEIFGVVWGSHELSLFEPVNFARQRLLPVVSKS